MRLYYISVKELNMYKTPSYNQQAKMLASESLLMVSFNGEITMTEEVEIWLVAVAPPDK